MNIVKRIFLVNFAAIHTSSTVSVCVLALTWTLLTTLHHGMPEHHARPI